MCYVAVESSKYMESTKSTESNIEVITGDSHLSNTHIWRMRDNHGFTHSFCCGDITVSISDNTVTHEWLTCAHEGNDSEAKDSKTHTNGVEVMEHMP